ncbi:hypothetical protein HS088_TW01G00637 [Tripterygium wilfordii]|uniref:Mitochondrial transcription termination factor family protein n=1 Tax=Tripterygium wilfordii TaxID=458696 RepID=A0A7J7E2G0_TRIWF|nr:transcription termination factor MTEF1, chloroplastic [Tripterygium wilfordii]KAF5752721.1 hypothetical protein HS088_TW01G00637 [Tripterygium wilfordii]
MRVAAAAFQSSLCISYQKPTPTHQPTIPLTAKPNSGSSSLHHHPLYTATQTNLSSQVKEKVVCLEIMGIDSGKALSQNPSLHSASLYSIQSIIFFLQSKGILQKDMPRIVGMCPQILTSNIRTDLLPVFIFLSQDLKVPDHDFRRVIKKCPRLLISSVNDQLRPCLFWLRRLGFWDLRALAYHDPVLLVSSVENTLIPKLVYLKSIGFSRDDVLDMVLRCPGLFTFSVENNLKPKFEYFVEDMKGDLEELMEFPQYFSFSLEKRIKPRHMEVVQSGLRVPLPLMLKSTDEEFMDLIR